MIKLKDIGSFQSIPQMVSDIIDGNIPALNAHWEQGWDIEEKINIGKYIRQSPLDYALIMECFASVKWLVEHNVNLNEKGNPSFLTAVRYCDEDIIRYVVAHGAKVNGVNNVKTDAFQQALYGKRYNNLPLIHELGHTVSRYGGQAFRSAVSDRNYEVLEFFLSNGVDINYQKPDQVYPFTPTPLCVAARYVDLPMCKYLVEHGADVTLTEKDGMRPYSIALEKGDIEMADYFKSLEPAEYHSLRNKLDELKPYKLTQAVIDFLQSENLHFDLPNCDFEYIDFFRLIDTIPMKTGRQKILRISKATGDYTHIYIVWNPKSKQIAYYDMEHEELRNICAFDDFMKELPMHMQRILDDELI